MNLKLRLPRDRWPYIWASIVFLLLMVCAALALGTYGAYRARDASQRAAVAAIQARDAAERANAIAQCINHNLGVRSAPSQADAAAHIAFAEAVNELFLPQNATAEQRAAEAQRFKRAVRVYVDTLVKDQAIRAAHPLGKC